MLRSIPSSMKKDWFDNPIETTGQFSGVVIDARKEEVLILAPTEAIETADSLEVAFSDSAVLPGAVKTDRLPDGTDHDPCRCYFTG